LPGTEGKKLVEGRECDKNVNEAKIYVFIMYVQKEVDNGSFLCGTFI